MIKNSKEMFIYSIPTLKYLGLIESWTIKSMIDSNLSLYIDEIEY